MHWHHPLTMENAVSTEDSKQTLVRQYFEDVQKPMDATKLPRFFHDDVRFHSEMGTLRGLKQFEYLIRSLYWPIVVPGTIDVELEFLDLTGADKQNHPSDPDQLVKFRAKITADRKKPGPDGDTVFQHEVVNIWRVEDGRCKAAWPDITEGGKDADVLAEASVSIAG